MVPLYITATRWARCLTTDRSCETNEIGQPEPLLQIQQQVDDACLDRHVERRNGLVEREDLRLGGQRPRNADALFLATGELCRVSGGVLPSQADDAEQLGHPVVDSSLVEPVSLQRFCQDVEHWKPRVQ